MTQPLLYVDIEFSRKKYFMEISPAAKDGVEIGYFIEKDLENADNKS